MEPARPTASEAIAIAMVLGAAFVLIHSAFHDDARPAIMAFIAAAGAFVGLNHRYVESKKYN